MRNSSELGRADADALRRDCSAPGAVPSLAGEAEGRPFVLPAGRILDASLEKAGIDRSEVHVTNVVKHFKWEPRGKRRIQQKPNAVEISACRRGSTRSSRS